MSFKASETGIEAADDASKDASHDFTAMAERLEFLEKEYRQMSALFHGYLARAERDDREDSENDSIGAAFTAACEITRMSSVEWRTVEDLGVPRNEYSLLTVGPKGRGESESMVQAVNVQSEASKATIEAPAEFTEASKSSNQNAYRMILNGRPELMEVLGGIFNSLTLPGFYIWIWPFKYLITYEKKVRERLLEEESKFDDANEPLPLTVSQEPADAKGIIPNGDSLQLDCQQRPEASPVDVEQINEKDLGAEDQAPRDSDDTRKSEVEAEVRSGRVELETESDNRMATNATHTLSQAEMEATKAHNRGATTNMQMPPVTGKEKADLDERTRLRDELRCLVNFMDNDMKDIYSVQKAIDDGTRTTIAFDYLWQLFKPGDLVLEEGEQKRAFMVLSVTGGRALSRTAQTYRINKERFASAEEAKEKEAYLAKYPKTSPFVLDCFYLDFDGINFGARPKKFMLQEYDGEVPIRSLEVFPAKFDDSPGQTMKALIKRGKRFAKLARVDHKYYSGKTVREPPFFEEQGEVHGNIMIDFELAIKDFRYRHRYDREKPDFSFGTGVIANPTLPDDREFIENYNLVYRGSPQYKPTYFMEDAAHDHERRTDFTDDSPLLKEHSPNKELSKEALMLLPPRVYGFSLLDRKWYAFDLSKVEDIKGSNQGFERLVLPENHKKIVQALVQHHAKGPGPVSTDLRRPDQDFSMDVVRGKGKGLIILLHGVPGVGKTSTAECVAAQTKRPLFPITCGDIGIHAEQVEYRLNEYFDMAHKWGCVLLLDEADVFLTKREKGGDLQRNGIVSVFLRVLEYYSGILILTTNRIGEFDEAFSSRIHIKLYYPKLTRELTLEIWEMNMKRIANSELNIDVEEKEIMKFARKLWVDTKDKRTQRWNGRQIRNAFQSAIALAKWDHQENVGDGGPRPCLSARQFAVVAKTSAHFDTYISKMHGFESNDDAWEILAARDFLRRNESPRKATRRSAMAARAMSSRRTSMKVEGSDEDEDEDEDENEDEDEDEEKGETKTVTNKEEMKLLALFRKARDTQLQTPTARRGESQASSDESE